MEYVSILIALVVALVACGLVHNSRQPKDAKTDVSKLLLTFAVVFSLSFLISKLVVDNNDDKQILHNIKIGDPPF